MTLRMSRVSHLGSRAAGGARRRSCATRPRRSNTRCRPPAPMESHMAMPPVEVLCCSPTGWRR
eukprot:4791484-Alexandrium_andersonii.AAC.1